MLNFFHDEAFEDVAFLDVIELGHSHAALIAGSNFLGLVLEPLQRTNLTLMDDDVVAEHTDLGIAGDLAILDQRGAKGRNTIPELALVNAARVGLISYKSGDSSF